MYDVSGVGSTSVFRLLFVIILTKILFCYICIVGTSGPVVSPVFKKSWFWSEPSHGCNFSSLLTTLKRRDGHRCHTHICPQTWNKSSLNVVSVTGTRLEGQFCMLCTVVKNINASRCHRFVIDCKNWRRRHKLFISFQAQKWLLVLTSQFILCIYSAFADIVTRNCHFPALGRNCMSHRPATAAKLFTQQCNSI
jgi:hypothetical protein